MLKRRIVAVALPALLTFLFSAENLAQIRSGNGAPVGTAGLVATTTLQAETGNNTSASDAFRGRLNGLPPAGNVSKIDTRTLLYPGSSTKIYASLSGWFGESTHMDVGYRSDQPGQVRRQVEDMRSRGIQGAIFDWFGPDAPVINRTAQLLRTEAEAHSGFEFAIMEDAGALVAAAKANACDVTAQLIRDLEYINTQFVPSPAYTRVNGRPVIFFFGVDAYYIDWSRVLASVANNPLFVFRGIDGLTRSEAAGGFQWQDINADPFRPASPNPFDPSLGAQNAFYTQAKASRRLTVGSTYQGFNDTLAPWGIDRFVHQRCGQTWLDTFNEIGKLYSATDQLPALQIVTWNDYDEGSAVEPGIDNCVALQPAISGTTLTWTLIAGNENTVNHFSIFASTDGQNLARLADVSSSARSFDLTPYGLTSGAYQLFVEAVGKPNIRNHMSAPVTFRAGTQAPRANLAVSLTGPLTVQASTTSSDPVAGSTIDFGDGTVVAGPTASHTYVSVGAFNVTATVVGNGGVSAVAVQRVSAKATSPGVTIFSPTPGATVNWPEPAFAASANSANPIRLMRVLLDGVQIYAIDSDVVNTPLKVYTGEHQVEVQAVDSTGAVSSATVNVAAQPGDPAPVAVIQQTPLPNVSPNTILFCGANWQDPGRFVNAYRWTFSDGSTAFTPAVAHTFAAPGAFSTTLSVINEFGTPGSATQGVNAGSIGAAASRRAPVRVQSPEPQKQGEPIRVP